MASQGRFTWFELVTPNVDEGRAFWSAVGELGQSSMNIGMGDYRMLTSDEKPVAGVVEPQMPGVPPHWLSYWEFGEIDERVAAVRANGGAVHVPPMDIPSVGRIAVVADPQGASFALFKSADGGEPGDRFHWNELWARNAEAVLPFYQKSLGVKTEVSQMSQRPYHIVKFDDTMVAGVMTSRDANVPPMWLPYLKVDDVDAAINRARSLGGRVIAEVMHVEKVGRFGIVADRQGAVMGLIQPDGN